VSEQEQYTIAGKAMTEYAQVKKELAALG